jgi:hypothetical protein
MKRFYILHESDWDRPVEFAWKSGTLGESFEGKGCAWYDLADGHRLVVGDFKSEDREDAWNSHPAVVHLHHPVREKTLLLSDLLTRKHAHKRFTSRHLELLAPLRVTGSDTLESLNQKISAVHPGCCIYSIPKGPSGRWVY